METCASAAERGMATVQTGYSADWLEEDASFKASSTPQKKCYGALWERMKFWSVIVMNWSKQKNNKNLYIYIYLLVWTHALNAWSVV